MARSENSLKALNSKLKKIEQYQDALSSDLYAAIDRKDISAEVQEMINYYKDIARLNLGKNEKSSLVTPSYPVIDEHADLKQEFELLGKELQQEQQAKRNERLRNIGIDLDAPVKPISDKEKELDKFLNESFDKEEQEDKTNEDVKTTAEQQIEASEHVTVLGPAPSSRDAKKDTKPTSAQQVEASSLVDGSSDTSTNQKTKPKKGWMARMVQAITNWWQGIFPSKQMKLQQKKRQLKKELQKVSTLDAHRNVFKVTLEKYLKYQKKQRALQKKQQLRKLSEQKRKKNNQQKGQLNSHRQTLGQRSQQRLSRRG